MIHDGNQCLTAICRSHLPRGEQFVATRYSRARVFMDRQSVIIAFMHQRIMLLKETYLALHGFLFTIRHLRDVKLVSEGPGHRNCRPRRQRTRASRLLIRHHRYMRPHRRNRITEGCPILDRGPADGIRIITAPNLRRIIQHPSVEASSSAAAAFEKDMRESLMDRLQNPIDPEHIPVRYLALPRRIGCM